MRAVAVAPGVVKLFGEHAVVYGKPAIAMAIDRFVKVSAERVSSTDDVIVASRDLNVKGIEVRRTGNEVLGLITDKDQVTRLTSYILAAIEIVEEKLGIRLGGVRIMVDSQLPIGAGLATSAAVSVATIAACTRLLGVELSKEELARLGHAVELRVQGAASPMDTSTSALGGVAYIRPGVEYRKLSVDRLPVVIGYVEREKTTGELVKEVRGLYNRHRRVVEGIMDAIGMIVEEAVGAIERGDYITLGELMNINQGLLEALGVSNQRLSNMIYAARRAGALGAKISGGGGGGAIVALSPGLEDKVSLAIGLSGGIAFTASVNNSGVVARLEM